MGCGTSAPVSGAYCDRVRYAATGVSTISEYASTGRRTVEASAVRRSVLEKWEVAKAWMRHGVDGSVSAVQPDRDAWPCGRRITATVSTWLDHVVLQPLTDPDAPDPLEATIATEDAASTVARGAPSTCAALSAYSDRQLGSEQQTLSLSTSNCDNAPPGPCDVATPPGCLPTVPSKLRCASHTAASDSAGQPPIPGATMEASPPPRLLTPCHE